jgi:uncharacterized protein (DUF433 family)
MNDIPGARQEQTHRGDLLPQPMRRAGRVPSRHLAEEMNMPKKQRKVLGRFVVTDPAICHGKPTFLGTRIMVAQVLKQVAKGMPWDAIMAEWRGALSKDAIAEAVELAQRAFEDHAADYAQESLPA